MTRVVGSRSSALSERTTDFCGGRSESGVECASQRIERRRSRGRVACCRHPFSAVQGQSLEKAAKVKGDDDILNFDHVGLPRRT